VRRSMALVVRQAGQRAHRYQYRAADGGADRRREQHGHVPGLAVVPCRNQGFGILKDLRIGRAALCRFLLGGLPHHQCHRPPHARPPSRCGGDQPDSVALMPLLPAECAFR